MTPAQKKMIVKFVAAGVAAILIGKVEGIINKRADDYFGNDEDQKDN
jgi:hypothetical protein